MRRAAVLAALLLAACQEQPTFDERYGATANQLDRRARQIDAQLNQAEANNQQSAQQR